MSGMDAKMQAASRAAAKAKPKAATTVVIHNFAFSPGSIKVKPGQKVKVENMDSVAHTLTSTTGKFNTGDIAPGKTVTFTAPKTAGRYPYRCQDKLPKAASTAAGLVRDLRRFRSSLHEQVTGAIGGDPMLRELTEAKGHLVRARETVGSRAALYRSIGLTDDEISGRVNPLEAEPPAQRPERLVVTTAAGPLDEPACN
jgi:plastocyanin